MGGLRAVLLALAWAGIAVAQQAVSFPTQDGGTVQADSYGRGDRAVLLLHGGRFRKESWAKQGKALAAAGFRALAIEFRASSEPPDEDMPVLDVLAAVRYLRKTGATTVSVVGASMGGDYAALAAEQDPDAIDRLVLLASGAYTPLKKMKGAKLFIVARNDANADGPRLPKIQAQYEKAREPKKLVIVDGSAHAQFLFDTGQGERVLREIEQFLSAA